MSFVCPSADPSPSFFPPVGPGFGCSEGLFQSAVVCFKRFACGWLNPTVRSDLLGGNIVPFVPDTVEELPIVV
jgi:hypothetical protein